jgi:hypothetical protein
LEDDDAVVDANLLEDEETKEGRKGGGYCFLAVINGVLGTATKERLPLVPDLVLENAHLPLDRSSENLMSHKPRVRSDCRVARVIWCLELRG